MISSVFLLFSAAMQTGVHVDNDTMEAGIAYRTCMQNEAARYGPKTDRVDDAIDAATAACGTEREALEHRLKVDYYVDAAINGGSMREYAANRHTRVVMEAINSSLRPELARAALDAR